MVPDHIHHDPDVESVAGTDQVFEVVSSTEMGVYGINVFGPISMEPVVSVGDYRRDPDSVGTQILDVVKVVDDSLEVTSTIRVGRNIAGRRGAITDRKTKV